MVTDKNFVKTFQQSLVGICGTAHEQYILPVDKNETVRDLNEIKTTPIRKVSKHTKPLMKLIMTQKISISQFPRFEKVRIWSISIICFDE